MTVSFDTFLNIAKPFNRPIYRSTLIPRASNIAYVTSDPVSSTTSLTITDRSTSLPANRVEDLEVTNLIGIGSFSTVTENFLLTDVYATATGTNPIPLFYKHIIPRENASRATTDTWTLADGVVLVGVDILDTYMEPIEQMALAVDYANGIIYSNLLSEYESASIYSIYYVKYTIRDSSDSSVHTYTELLNLQPTFQPATVEDLEPGTLQIKLDGRKVYFIEEEPSSFTVILPRSGTYAYKPTEESRLRTILPLPRALIILGL